MGGLILSKMYTMTDDRPFVRAGLAVIMSFGVFSAYTIADSFINDRSVRKDWNNLNEEE